MAKRKAKAKRKTTKRAKGPTKKVKRKAPKKKKRKNLADRAKDELARKPTSQKKIARKLTAKQILFVNCYLGAARCNATKAAILAGYSKKSVNSEASQLMANPKVKSYLKRRQDDIARRLDITQERVAKEMAVMAFSKPTEFMRWANGTLTITNSDEIPDELVDAVSSIEISPGKYGRTMKVKFHDKIAAGKVLAQYLGMLHERPRDSDKGSIMKMFAETHEEAEGVGDKE